MNETEEKIVQVANGWVRLSFHLLMLVAAIVLLIVAPIPGKIAAAITIPVTMLLLLGHFTVQPNEAAGLATLRKLSGHRASKRILLGQSIPDQDPHLQESAQLRQ